MIKRRKKCYEQHLYFNDGAIFNDKHINSRNDNIIIDIIRNI